MGDMHQSRNLSVSQTLDEILGLAPRRDAVSSSSSSIMEKNSINSPYRPPTRHGRESASSNEENKDPNSSTSIAETSSSISRKMMLPRQSFANEEDDPEDEFIQKLNEMRRRSLISMEFHSTPSTSSQKEKPAPRLPIHVEVEEFQGTQTPTMSPGLRPPSSATSNLTFRVDEKRQKIKPAVQNGKPRPDRLPTPSRHPKSNSAPPTKNEGEFQSTLFSRETTSADSHHSKWLKKKLEAIKSEKEKKLKEEESKKLAEKEKRENAAKLFERWKADRDKKISEETKSKLISERQKLEREKEEKDRKKIEAQKNFEMWKRERSKSVGDIKKKIEEDEEQKRKEKEIERVEKQKEAKAAFDAWLAKKKEDALKNTEKANGKEEDDETKQYRRFMAREAYETWLEMKDQERDIMADMVLIEAPPIPWIPPSNMVPRRFVRSAGGGKRRSQSAKSVNRRKPTRPSTTTSLKPFR